MQGVLDQDGWAVYASKHLNAVVLEMRCQPDEFSLIGAFRDTFRLPQWPLPIVSIFR